MGQLDPLLMDYRRHLLAAGKGAGTIKQRVYYLCALQASHPDLLKVTTEDLETYLARRRRTHAAESRRSIKSSFQSFYRWATRSGRIDSDPSEILAPIHVPRSYGRRAPDDVVLDGLRTATLPEKAMILLGRMAGLRLSEITKLHARDRQGDMLRIVGKGEKMRLVPINNELLEVLERLELHVGDDYYFPGRWGGHASIDYVSKHIRDRVGMNPHSLRHAAATAAYRGTGDLRAVQEFLGHASLSTTQIYIHTEVDQIRAAAMATAFGTPDAMAGSAIERSGFSGGAGESVPTSTRRVANA